MAPGPKKRFNQKASSDKILVSSENKSKLLEVKDVNNDVSNLNDADKEFDMKYGKRRIESNWDRYNESVEDPYADKKRGNEFEMILNYSGGTNSQLQLQDEKEWNESCADNKSIFIDFSALIIALKCAPLHKRLHLQEDIFDYTKILEFKSIACNNKKEYLKKAYVQPAPQSQMSNSSLNIIESLETEDACLDREMPYVIENKTESLIESLATCLSAKDKILSIENFNDSSNPGASKTPSTEDDLDFLLSLSLNTSSAESTKTKSNTNVDDWLSSILDD